MPNVVNSTFMSLPVPIVGVEFGPQYALDVNACMAILDQHDHTPGLGVQITPLGLNINTDLTFNSNNATNMLSVKFDTQGAPLSASVTGALYMSGADLYFNDASGAAIQITKAGTVNAVLASLPGESYAAGTFIWKQGAGSTVPALFDIGSFYLRPPIAATTNGLYISCPSGISSVKNLVLPVPPASGSAFVREDNLGNQSAVVEIDNSTLEINSNTLRVKDLGITAAKLSSGAATAGSVATADGSGNVSYIPNTTPLGTVYTFTSSTSWTVPAGVRLVSVLICGGGGGGAGGGVGGYGPPISGAAGGTSSFGSFSVLGGSGGRGAAAGPVVNTAGSGGRGGVGGTPSPASGWEGDRGLSGGGGGGGAGGGNCGGGGGGAGGDWPGVSATGGTSGAGGGGGGGIAYGAGGGGGGGNDATGSSDPDNSWGGNGGSSSRMASTVQLVTPGSSVSITIGGGGGGGGARPFGGAGGAGAQGICIVTVIG